MRCSCSPWGLFLEATAKKKTPSLNQCKSLGAINEICGLGMETQRTPAVFASAGVL